MTERVRGMESQRLRDRLRLVREHLLASGGGDAREAAEGGYDLDREVWDLALAEQVRDAMQRLHPGERAAVELAYFGGRTYREVATELGEAEGTMKSRIRSGLKRLRSELVAAGVTVGDV